ncbi:helix-turn-helix domain-containing protein [Rhodococcus hoagii]|nr:helix-turn-helix domain-containing protein [Prescottella equi]
MPFTGSIQPASRSFAAKKGSLAPISDVFPGFRTTPSADGKQETRPRLRTFSPSRRGPRRRRRRPGGDSRRRGVARELAHQEGLHTEEVAAALDMSPSTYSRLERGERPVTNGDTATLASLFGIEPEQVRSSWMRAHQRPGGTRR